MEINWTQEMRAAYRLAMLSPDPSTKNGAIIIGLDGKYAAVGINDFPAGLKDVGLSGDRETKYAYIEHAERNAIYMAARNGISLLNATMVCPWAACPDCARAIVQAGIINVVIHKQALDQTPERWRAAIDRGIEIFETCGVRYKQLDEEIGRCINTFNGAIWYP